MLLQGVKLIRVEYTVDDTVYKIAVAAKNLESIISYLSQTLQKPFKITTVENLGNLKIITPEVVDVILQARQAADPIKEQQIFGELQPEVKIRKKPGPKPKVRP